MKAKKLKNLERNMKTLDTKQSKEIRELANKLRKIMEEFRKQFRALGVKAKKSPPQTNSWTTSALEKLENEMGFWIL
jgi:hypothetical protein